MTPVPRDDFPFFSLLFFPVRKTRQTVLCAWDWWRGSSISQLFNALNEESFWFFWATSLSSKRATVRRGKGKDWRVKRGYNNGSRRMMMVWHNAKRIFGSSYSTIARPFPFFTFFLLVKLNRFLSSRVRQSIVPQTLFTISSTTNRAHIVSISRCSRNFKSERQTFSKRHVVLVFADSILTFPSLFSTSAATIQQTVLCSAPHLMRFQLISTFRNIPNPIQV